MKKFAIASMLSIGFGICTAGQAVAADTTPPVITPTVSGTLGTADWYTGDVSLSWKVSDPESRVSRKSGCGDVSVRSDTSGHTYTCAATSTGGRSTKSVTIKRDATLPAATITVPANGATYTAGQSCRGELCVQRRSIRRGRLCRTGCDRCRDRHGIGREQELHRQRNRQSGQREIRHRCLQGGRHDPAGDHAHGQRHAGRQRLVYSNVNVSWAVTDAQSSIGAQSGCGTVAITADTSGATYTCTATSAGGTSSKSVMIKRDATRPAATITAPASGATYALNQSVTANYACSDALSGPAGCTGAVANGAGIDTSTAGTKTFAVSATDLAGNATTASVTYTVSGGTTSSLPGTQLFAWNDLGMHCMDSDFSVFTLLPPFNNLNAQLVVGGKVVDSTNYALTYESSADPATGSINTSSAGKSNFWQYVLSLFGASVPDNYGLTGNPTASTTPAPLTWNSAFNWFEATGIPITPVDDGNHMNAYPIVKVTARNTSGQAVASSNAVLPVSSEITCSICHATNTGSSAAQPKGGWVGLAPGSEKDWRMNVLRLHDEKNAANPIYAPLMSGKGYGTSLELSAASNKPILCDTCHNSNALAIWGIAGQASVSNMTAAMHNRHATVTAPGAPKALDAIGTRDACYACHPGKDTECLRGAMGNPVNASGQHIMECQSCHGSMLTVGKVARNGWFDMPTCQSCHHDGLRETLAINADGTFRKWTDVRFASNPDKPVKDVSLFRFSTGHGNLQCEACHNSTHAEFTNKPSAAGNQVNDNRRAIAVQGYAASIRECTACHATTPRTVNGGPHGMHSIGSSWVSSHHDSVSSSNRADCFYCHGSNSAGSPLAVIKVAKTFNVGDGRSKTFAVDERVTCWSCHNGPNP